MAKTVATLDPVQQAAIDAADASIAVIDRDGVIIAVNRRWRAFGDENGRSPTASDIGRYYPVRGHDGITGVLAGYVGQYATIYPCHSPSEKRWFRLLVVPVGAERDRFLVIHRRLADAPTAAHLEPAGEELGRRWLGTQTACGWCDRQVRDAMGAWREGFVEPDRTVSHGLCPTCAATLLPEAPGTAA